MARTFTVDTDPRERAALAIWLLELDSPKNLGEARLAQSVEAALDLTETMDKMADPRLRPPIRSLPREPSLAFDGVTEAVIRYVVESIDPEKRPNISGHIWSVLVPFADRLRDVLKAKQDPAPAG